MLLFSMLEVTNSRIIDKSLRVNKKRMTVSRSICLGFIAVILTGTLLLMMPFATTSGYWNDPIVALFTSTSAVCVTGHVVVDTATYFSRAGQVIIMLLIQVGGLGYMTATTFLLLLLGRRFGLRDKIAIQEALDRRSLQGSTQILQSIIATTLLSCCGCLSPMWAGPRGYGLRCFIASAPGITPGSRFFPITWWGIKVRWF
jgi:Trk-type K+ transport system membrane component